MNSYMPSNNIILSVCKGLQFSTVAHLKVMGGWMAAPY